MIENVNEHKAYSPENAVRSSPVTRQIVFVRIIAEVTPTIPRRDAMAAETTSAGWLRSQLLTAPICVD